MDESTLTAILALALVALFFSDSAISLLGAAALIPLASKIPFPI